MKVSIRAKSMVALGACMVVVLAMAAVVGARAFRAITVNLGSAYARNATQYNKQRILTPVLRELALAERLADSEVTRRWIEREDDPGAREMFFAEANRYRRTFAGRSFFVASALSRHYYFSDGKSADDRRPRYTLKKSAPDDAWFFNTMTRGRDTNLNVDINSHLKMAKVWFNIKVKDGHRDIGLVGTGLDLTRFLNNFLADHGTGVTPMIVNRDGAIQAHPDADRIDYASINDKGAARSALYTYLENEADRDAARGALRAAESDPNNSRLFEATMDGHRQLFAVSYIPELGWYVVTAVDLKAARLLDAGLWRTPTMVGLALLLLLSAGIVLILNRFLLRPLEELTRSARSMQRGDYTVSLPAAGGDEIGDLTRAFGAMAERVRTHTEQLEDTVQLRTAELSEANETLEAANNTVAESIRYAGLIQSAILPDKELENSLSDSHFVLWRPRDIVGGDFYVFVSAPDGFLVGVVDCAGHGVPGALMTMAAHGALASAIETMGPRNPAALLQEMDRRMRAAMPDTNAGAGLATQMDGGLAWIDEAGAEVVYAGARTSLLWSDGGVVEEMAGVPASIAGRRVGTFVNRVCSLPATGSFYLTTDGFLDQAGGPKGFGFGDRRFAELVRRAARLAPSAQRSLFEVELDTWRGERPQRDDVTVLALSCAGLTHPSRNNHGSYGRLPAERDLQRTADSVVL